MLSKKYRVYKVIDPKNSDNANNGLLQVDTKYATEDYYYSNELIYQYPQDEITAAIRSAIMQRYYKFYLLRNDETIEEDITPYVISSGSIENNNENGQCRSSNITLINELINMAIGYSNGKAKYGLRRKWSAADNKIWNFQKIRIDAGIELEGMKYEYTLATLVTFDPSINTIDHTVSMQLYDKFALLDGTISGSDDLAYTIPIGTKIKDAISSLLKLCPGNNGIPYDSQSIIFPSKYANLTTQYTIEKTGNNNIGDLIIELCKSISCDARYDENGHLEIIDTLTDLDYHNRQVVWNFKEDENELIEPSISITRSKIKNKVYVVGGNVNGYLVSGYAENTNPISIYNINSNFGVKGVKITDDLISSNELCKQRAQYELKKYSEGYTTFSFSSRFIPHIAAGDIIRLSYTELGIENEDFLVKSVSFPIDEKSNISITATNLKELPI